MVMKVTFSSLKISAYDKWRRVAGPTVFTCNEAAAANKVKDERAITRSSRLTLLSCYPPTVLNHVRFWG
jgi:hypothetical protein